MQAVFNQANRFLAGDIVLSRQAPFKTFAPAEGLRQFYADLAAHQQKEGAVLLGGFVYGGVFADLEAGRKPKDYDLYIASPNMVRALKAFESGALSDDDYMNEDEWAEMALGYDFPILPDRGLAPMKHIDVLGDYFEFTGSTAINGVRHKIDIKIGSQNPTMAEFLRYTPAPIMAAAMALDREDVYAYHRHCVDHAERGILCTDRVNAAHMIEKAGRKGLMLITPDQLAARDAQTRLLPAASAKAGEWRPII